MKTRGREKRETREREREREREKRKGSACERGYSFQRRGVAALSAERTWSAARTFRKFRGASALNGERFDLKCTIAGFCGERVILQDSKKLSTDVCQSSEC